MVPHVETKRVEISSEINLVDISLNENITTAKTANIDSGKKLSEPGRMISSMPINPIRIASQDCHLTFSLRRNNANILTIRGLIWIIAEAELRGVLAIAIQKKIAARRSANVRAIKNLFLIFSENKAEFL